MVESLRKRPKDWVAFMMRFELGLEQPEPSCAWKSALTIATAYIVGGVIPLSAYVFLSDAHSALRLSVVVTLAALAGFGGIKGRFTGVPILRRKIVGSGQCHLSGGCAEMESEVLRRQLTT